MKDYVKLWAEELPKLGSFSVKSKITVTGERDHHLGPRWEFAKIQVSVEPAESFDVVDAIPTNVELRQLGYLDWAIFGLLDVLMVTESAPLSNIRLILEEAEHHPVDSSRMAFRQAGRDAEPKIIEAFRQSSFA